MDTTADNSSSPNLSDADGSEGALSTPDPNLSEPRSPRLSDAVQFSNSSDVVCISSDESEPPPQKKKLTDFFKPARTRTPAFPNALRRFEPQPRGAQEQTPATGSQQSMDQPSGSSQNPQATTTAPSSPVRKRKAVYASYTLRQKLEVVGYAKAHTDAEAARHFGIPRTTLGAWKGLELQPKDRKKSQNRKGKHVRKGTHSGRPLSYSEAIEDQLLQWILEARDQQLPIQRKTIQRRALALIKPQQPQFRASEGWLQKFLKRHSLSLRRTTSIQQKLPADLEKKLERFMQDVKALREIHQFPDNLIINMDETPIYFDMPKAHTIAKTGAREVRVRGTKGGKKRVTFVVTCSAAGQMLKPMVVFKGKTARSLKTVTQRSDIAIVHQKKAWMDSCLMLKWIKEVLLKHTKKQHCLLVFDSFKAHLTDDVLQALERANASVVVLPGGCTSKAQPVDVSLNRPIKDTVRGLWEEFMTSNMAHGSVSEAPAPTKNDVVEWIVRAHALLDSQPQCVAKSFKVCGISNKLDGSENALIHCAKELPAFTIPYGSDDSDEDIFNSDSDSDSGDEEDD